MKTSSSFAILVVIFLLSVLSAILLYFYMDPERNLPVAYGTMGTALFLAIASSSAMMLQWMKRIYYRGMIESTILYASIRQGIFIALGLGGLIIFQKAGILTWRTGGLLLFILFLFELMIVSLSENE